MFESENELVSAEKPSTSKENYIKEDKRKQLLFIEAQKEKLIRPFAIGNYVFVLKNFPKYNIYKGYLCNILEIYDGSLVYDSIGLKKIYHNINFYMIIFNSEFSDRDLSLISQNSNPNFKFCSTEYTMKILGRDLLRVEDQDLIHRTSFNI